MMPLFIVTPLCGSTYFEPNVDNRVCVTAAMLPSLSTTEKCVVQAGARCSAPSARRPWHRPYLAGVPGRPIAAPKHTPCKPLHLVRRARAASSLLAGYEVVHRAP